MNRFQKHIPMAAALGVEFMESEEGVIARLPFRESLIGNPLVPALHGGAMATFAEMAAQAAIARELSTEDLFFYPKTVNFYVDYLRPGREADCFALAEVRRLGRRLASVDVELWQEERTRLCIRCNGHFLVER